MSNSGVDIVKFIKVRTTYGEEVMVNTSHIIYIKEDYPYVIYYLTDNKKIYSYNKSQDYV